MEWFHAVCPRGDRKKRVTELIRNDRSQSEQKTLTIRGRTQWVEEDGDCVVTALCWGGSWPDDQGQADLPHRISHPFTPLIFFPLKTLLSNLLTTFLHIAVWLPMLLPSLTDRNQPEDIIIYCSNFHKDLERGEAALKNTTINFHPC